MARFYGTLQGNRGLATRTGSNKITASAQSYRGSVTTELTYEGDTLMVRVMVDENDSSTSGRTLFYGTFDEYIKKLS